VVDSQITLQNIFVDPKTKLKLEISDTIEGKGKKTLRSPDGVEYEIIDGVANLLEPQEVHEKDQIARNFYEGRARQYEDNLHLTFLTHGIDENSTRNEFIDKLGLKKSSKVLEIACGTGRDSVLISKRLDKSGELHMQDISFDMIRLCKHKFADCSIPHSHSISDVHRLPYPDDYFDAVYSFGALGEFSDQVRALKEIVRVSKKGAKVVIGDESVPVWLRSTDYYRILKETNPMFEAPLPLMCIPVCARNTSIHFVIGESFYIIEFTVGEGEPEANFNFKIPGPRGGTYNTRYFGKLEGITMETKAKLHELIRLKGVSMHEWLETVISDAIGKENLNGYSNEQQQIKDRSQGE
jgi:ubiquinone/menaquinone biosynthesis C-methylase UbiE